MNPSVSVFLDASRLLAALTVYFGHLAGRRFTDGILYQVGPFMDEAVTVFFVISGFVISYVVFDRSESRDDYVVARVARISSVAIPALILTAVLDHIGLILRPELYSEAWGFSGDMPVVQYLGAALFLNRIWYVDLSPGSNLPYWSLNFEVWFYILFGIMVFGRGWSRVVGLLLAMTICGPVILSYLPIWLIGVAAQRLCARALLGPSHGLVLFLISLLGLAGNAWALRHSASVGSDGVYFLLHSAATGLLFASALVGVSSAAPLVEPWFLLFGKPIRWAAGATFSIYLFHLPIAQFLTTILPWPPSHPLTRAIILLGTLSIIFVLAEITERRKELWKPLGQGLLTLAKTVGGIVSAPPRGRVPNQTP